MANQGPKGLLNLIDAIAQSNYKDSGTVLNDLIVFLNDSTYKIPSSELILLLSTLITLLKGSNFKISQKSVDILTILAQRLGSNFSCYLPFVLPHVIERLGDNKEIVREAVQSFLTNLITSNVLSGQLLIDKLIICYKHKNQKVREEFLYFLLNTINNYENSKLSFKSHIPLLVNLLNDNSMIVRDTTVLIFVEIYKKVGEIIRLDLRKKKVPIIKMTILERKFDEIKENLILKKDVDNTSKQIKKFLPASARIHRERPKKQIYSTSKLPEKEIPVQVERQEEIQNETHDIQNDESLTEEHIKQVQLSRQIRKQALEKERTQKFEPQPEQFEQQPEQLEQQPEQSEQQPEQSEEQLEQSEQQPKQSEQQPLNTSTSSTCYITNITPEIFELSFEMVPSLSSSTVNKFISILNIIGDKNVDCGNRITELKNIRAILMKKKRNMAIIIEYLPELSIAYLKILNDSRLQLIREACITLAYIAKILKMESEIFFSIILRDLIILMESQDKLFATCGTIVLSYVIKYVNSPRLIPILHLTLMNTTSSHINVEICKLLLLICNEWEINSFSRKATVIKDMLDMGINNADLIARQTSRIAFWSFKKHFSDLADSLFNSFDIATQKQLCRDREKLIAEQYSGSATSRITVPRRQHN